MVIVPNNTLRGEAGDDDLFGADGDDNLIGRTGNNVLTDSVGTDVRAGGLDNDVYSGTDTFESQSHIRWKPTWKNIPSQVLIISTARQQSLQHDYGQ